MSENTKNTGLKVALGIAIALFVGTGIFSSSIYKDKVETEKQLTEEKMDVMRNLNDMASKYDLALSESEITNQNLVDARARIKGLIDSLKVSGNNVRSLWRYKKKYMALQKEMDVILAENDELKVENAMLATTLDSTKVQLEERTMFTDSLMLQNTELAEVVEGAAVLTTTSLKASGVIERNNGKLIPTERARRSDKVRICFAVAKNRLIETGDKELYIQVIDPESNLLGTNEQIKFGEQALNYSLISKFYYENDSLDICEFVTNANGEDFEKGRYQVNVFNQNELISSSSFTLK